MGGSRLRPLSFLFRDSALHAWFFDAADLCRRCLFLTLPLLLGKDGTASGACVGCLLALASAAAIREVWFSRFQNFKKKKNESETRIMTKCLFPNILFFYL